MSKKPSKTFLFFAYAAFAMDLFTFIQEAEAEYSTSGSGPEKLEVVASRFNGLVSKAEQAGFIKSDLAEVLRADSIDIIEMVLRHMKKTGDLPAPVAAE